MIILYNRGIDNCSILIKRIHNLSYAIWVFSYIVLKFEYMINNFCKILINIIMCVLINVM